MKWQSCYLVHGLSSNTGDWVRKTTSGWGQGRRLFGAEPGPPCPGMRRIRPQHPGCRARGRRGCAPRPRSPFSTPRGARPPLGFPRRPAYLRVWAGGGRRRRAASPGHPGGCRIPPTSQPPPLRSGTLAFLLRARVVQPAAPGPKLCARVRAAREAPPGRPSQHPPAPAAGMQGRERTAPHLRLVHTCSRQGRRGRSSAPAPPLARPLLRPPWPPRAGGGGKRRPGPGARAGALCLLPGAGAGPRSRHCFARRSGAPVGEAAATTVPVATAAFLRVGAFRSQSKGKERVAHLREPDLRGALSESKFSKLRWRLLGRTPCVCRGLLNPGLVARAPWCNWHSSKREGRGRVSFHPEWPLLCLHATQSVLWGLSQTPSPPWNFSRCAQIYFRPPLDSRELWTSPPALPLDELQWAISQHVGYFSCTVRLQSQYYSIQAERFMLS